MESGEEPLVAVDDPNAAATAFASFATALEALVAGTQHQLVHKVMGQTTRLVHCEQTMQRALETNRILLESKRVTVEQQQREIEDLEARVRTLQSRLNKEKRERDEEKKWLTQLWPDGLVLPTLLKPYEVANDLEYIEDTKQRLQALVNRRVMRERVRRQVEASQHWKMVVEPATDDVAEQVYYMNEITGQSVWQAPLAMVYEPPMQWDIAKKDWKDSYGLEHFYPVSTDVEGNDVESDDSDGADSARVKTATPSRRNRSDDEEETEEQDEEDMPADPVALRAQMTEEMEKAKQLQLDLAKSQAQQRSCALQLLNASRESFEREKEALAEEDEAKRDIERKKRKARLQEQAASNAKAAAQEKKTSNSVQSKFGKDSVGKKDLTFSKDDEQLERELDEFVLQERADRPYLTVPIALDPRVKLRHQLDDEYVHMKAMEAKALEIEQLEFDLLEKSSLRHEESTAKEEELFAFCDEIRSRQPEVQQDLDSAVKAITRLEIPLSPPSEPRPSAEQLEQASGRYVTLQGLDNGDDGDDDDAAEKSNASDAEREVVTSPDVVQSQERERVASEVAKENMTSEEVAALLRDEEELLLFKSYVDAEQRWRDWEREEVVRLEELAQATERRKALEVLQRQLAIDLALYESDAPFFARVGELEKELNTRMWQIQADSQIERVRFMIERAAREEAIFQMDDRFEELQVQLEAAQRLPMQALNALEHLDLEMRSRELCDSLAKQISRLQERYEKEMAAKALLTELETRSYEYAFTKLQEEVHLFGEKQTLLDLNVALGDDLQESRKTIERLYLLIHDQPESPSEPLIDNQRLLSLSQQREDATAVIEGKLQYLQQARQFLMTCYDREARWRSLASIALVKDCSSEEWMTTMQRERHESMMAILQEQHDTEVLELKKQIKLLQKVKTALHFQIDELTGKLDRMRLAYQESSDHVRQQTECVIRALTEESEQEKRKFCDEKTRAQEARERLIREHGPIREELEQRLLELEGMNEKQCHWLTAAKRELNAQRSANKELVKAYQSLEKRRAAETNDMRFRIASQIKKINNIEMWNLSLKLKAKEAHAERIQMQKEMALQVQHHKQQQQLLRLKNWRHRVTAQAILTDVDLLFRFFADGFEILSGTTSEINAALRENGAIEVIAALAQHCHQAPVKAICAKALGQLAWNANATKRSLGWNAKRKWFDWVSTQSEMVLQKLNHENKPFDAVAEEETAEMNWLADTSNVP
uniref:WW domain-containing protein n=1 Tax=Globisporangium ultimum (strain ATCC 200006 / CBS 805.95 / DAOM BR144) TaxID=431595 RepID=K3WZT0_GLOUD